MTTQTNNLKKGKKLAVKFVLEKFLNENATRKNTLAIDNDEKHAFLGVGKVLTILDYCCQETLSVISAVKFAGNLTIFDLFMSSSAR